MDGGRGRPCHADRRGRARGGRVHRRGDCGRGPRTRTVSSSAFPAG